MLENAYREHAGSVCLDSHSAVDTHLEALTGVAVAAAPHTEGKLVVQREEQRPGHILTINKEKLVTGDQQ